jgi:AraC-like DNA-binding protein
MSKLERQEVSPKRQNEGLWTTLAKTHAAGNLLPKHQHQTGQLVFATSGVMLVETQLARWTVPPQRALWIPPGHAHAIHILSDTALRTVYCQSELIEQCAPNTHLKEVHAVTVSPLIQELVLSLFDHQFDHATRHAMVCLLLQTLRQTPSLPTSLPMPSSPGLYRAITELLETRQWQLQMHEIASMAALSERTFSRRFTNEVGVNFRVWRQRARIVASLDLLASDRSIKSIASSLQFASAASYIATFHSILGCTPNAFRLENIGGRKTANVRVDQR